MTIIKSVRKPINSLIEAHIYSIKYDYRTNSNKISWTITNAKNENIKKIQLIIFENDTSVNNGEIKIVKTYSPEIRECWHYNIDYIVNQKYFKIYSYQLIIYTDVTSKASAIERFDVRDIFECKPPSQVTFSIKQGRVYFSIKCEENKFATNIFIYRKDYYDDTFERIAVIPYMDNYVFIDRNVSIGHYYEYRFMSYDIFDHYSQKIVKVNVFVWDKVMETSRSKTLADPVPLAEYASEKSAYNQLIRLKITNVDKDCIWYHIKRRDLSEKTFKFEAPEQWMSSSAVKNNGGDIEFLDRIVKFGSYYQYSVYGVDQFGNSSDNRISNVVKVGQTNLPDVVPVSPINISAQIIQDYPTGVKINWVDGNLNQMLDRIISGSSDLFPKENLYYFKVFRRRHDELNYQSFPEQSGTDFTDMCDDDGAFRQVQSVYYKPDPPIRDNKYFYYVATYNQNGLMSNRSPEVIADLTILPVEIQNLKISYNDAIEPLKCILTWTIAENEKTLDSFVVDRLDASKGIWENVGKAYFSTRFIDNTIEKSKQYMWRVQAKDFAGNTSVYAYCVLKT